MGIRTPDLLIANETLYQLSYDPIHQRRSYYAVFKCSGKTKWISLETADRELATRKLKEDIEKFKKTNPKSQHHDVGDAARNLSAIDPGTRRSHPGNPKVHRFTLPGILGARLRNRGASHYQDWS